MTKLFLFIFCYAPMMVVAETVSTSSGPITTDYMAKLLLSLSLVVIVIFALAWMVKRFNFIPQQKQGLIKIISTLSVSTRDRIALIEVGDEQLLIALTPGKITKLHSLKTPVKSIQKTTPSSFKNKFDSIMDKQTNSTPVAEKNDD